MITLADWYVFRCVSDMVLTVPSRYHIASPVLNYIVGVNAVSTVINGFGRYPGGPKTELAVVNVEYGKRYRFRLVAMSCDPNFLFSIDGHNLTVIETEGQLTEPLLVDSLQVFAGQRYSVIMNATQPVGNYWIRALPNTPNATFAGGLNSAILRYNGAPSQDPTTNHTTSRMPLLEQNLHALINPGAPGIPEYGKADINLEISANNIGGVFYMNGVRYRPPTVPVLLQILSGAQEATDLMPNGSVIVLQPNKVVELTMKTIGFGGPVSLFFDRFHAAPYILCPASHPSAWGSYIAKGLITHLTCFAACFRCYPERRCQYDLELQKPRPSRRGLRWYTRATDGCSMGD